MSRAKGPNEAYQTLVARTCAKLKTWRFSEIRMKHAPEGRGPVAIRGQVPDLTGVLEETLYIFGVETRGSLGGDAAHARMAAFSQYAVEKRAVFVLVVPGELEDAAYQTVRLLGLPNTVVYPVPQWPASRSDSTSAQRPAPFALRRKPS
ncbi:MAG: hypothetical protein AB1916_13965 [Thermodesulfobacteriota bacterium]